MSRQPRKDKQLAATAAFPEGGITPLVRTEWPRRRRVAGRRSGRRRLVIRWAAPGHSEVCRRILPAPILNDWQPFGIALPRPFGRPQGDVTSALRKRRAPHALSRSSRCANFRNSRHREANSRNVPTSTIRPASITTIRSASSSVLGRCVMMNAVRPRVNSSST
jgi:hypothetical protein